MYFPCSWLTGLLSALVSIVLFSGIAYPQQPVTYYHLPASPSVGDTLLLMVNWGTEDEPLQEVDNLSCSLYYSGFQIDPASTCTIEGVDSSWFLKGIAYSYEVSIDTGLRRIDLVVQLPPDSLRSGHGFCLGLGGPVVIVDDVTSRKGVIDDAGRIAWTCWYDRTGRRLGPRRPLTAGLYLREGVNEVGRPIRKRIFIR
ncbi:MAG: hypothetical protein R3B47_14450 [Bacteroidia bacterium]